jgi:hypothetical protein
MNAIRKNWVQQSQRLHHVYFLHVLPHGLFGIWSRIDRVYFAASCQDHEDLLDDVRAIYNGLDVPLGEQKEASRTLVWNRNVFHSF